VNSPDLYQVNIGFRDTVKHDMHKAHWIARYPSPYCERFRKRNGACHLTSGTVVSGSYRDPCLQRHVPFPVNRDGTYAQCRGCWVHG